MRSDAKKNREHLLTVSRVLVAEQGAEVSLRDLARKAGVGLGTLYRHFPTREALLEALLRTGFDELAAKAVELETAASPREALASWFREVVGHARAYHGVTSAMMSAIQDERSALHASCIEMQAAGTRLLTRAQADGTARSNMDGVDLFALIGALAWLGDQPALASRRDHLLGILLGAVLRTPNDSVH